MRYEFEDFVLDARGAELTRNGKAIHVEPQVFDVLLALVAAVRRQDNWVI